MRILVDADACPVVDIAISLARKYNKQIILYYDDAHQTQKDYATIRMVLQGPDAVDYALINDLEIGDIVITQDYGVAQMALAKGAYPINQNGMIYNEGNISYLLEVRNIMSRERRSNKKTHLKGPKKRTKENDIAFYNTLSKMLEETND